MVKILSATEAVATYIKDGDTDAFGGFVGSAHPGEMSATNQENFLEKDILEQMSF